MEDEEIEELDDEDVEVEQQNTFDLYWTCKECKTENVEYNILLDDNIICTCDKCGKKYQYYHCIY